MSSRHSPSPIRAVLDLQNARSLLGKRLSVLLHDQYYFNDEKDLGDIGSLEWRFGEQEVLSMYLLSDGEGVGADLLFFTLSTGKGLGWPDSELRSRPVTH